MAKNEHPAFLFYVDDFSSDGKVEAMTTEAVGAYTLLLCKAWRESPVGSIPNNDQVLARWSRLSLDQWAACRPLVLAAFTLGTDDRWHQKRMRNEYARLQQKRKINVEKAKKAVAARISKSNIEKELRSTRCLEDNLEISPGDPRAFENGNGVYVSEEEFSLRATELPRSTNGSLRKATEDSVSVWFDECFWKEYPRKVSKLQALKWCQKHATGASTQKLIMDGLAVWNVEFRTRDTEKIPYPATFLNSKDWLPDSRPQSRAEKPTPMSELERRIRNA